MKYFFYMLLFSFSTIAQPPAPVIREIWNIGNQFFPMIKESKRGVLISVGCEQKKMKCDAYSALMSPKNYKLNEEDLSGGKNPGAVACKKHYNAEILILKDARNNENSFCKFKDGSLVSASAI